jgi:hypothetical protein
LMLRGYHPAMFSDIFLFLEMRDVSLHDSVS